MLTNINFGSGKIIYNELHIDFNQKPEEQVDSLTEDLLQVEYPNKYIIDLGWYPECDARGYFILNVIDNHNWEKSVMKKILAYNPDFICNALSEAVKLAERRDPIPRDSHY